MKIFIGNMPRNISEELLRKAFEVFGEVESLNIVLDKDTGISKGFGFVTMKSAEAGQKAIDIMHGKDIMGRPVTVAESKSDDKSKAKPKKHGKPK